MRCCSSACRESLPHPHLLSAQRPREHLPCFSTCEFLGCGSSKTQISLGRFNNALHQLYLSPAHASGQAGQQESTSEVTSVVKTQPLLSVISKLKGTWVSLKSTLFLSDLSENINEFKVLPHREDSQHKCASFPVALQRYNEITRWSFTTQLIPSDSTCCHKAWPFTPPCPPVSPQHPAGSSGLGQHGLACRRLFDKLHPRAETNTACLQVK